MRAWRRCSRSQVSSASTSGRLRSWRTRSALVRRHAVDLALDREQGIDALDCLDRDRRLVDAAPGRRTCAAHAPSRRPRRSAPACGAASIEPVEPGIGIRLHQAGIARQMLLGMLAAAVGRVEECRRRRIGGRRTAGRRAHRSIADRCGTCPWPAPARWCRRHGCARPQTRGCGSHATSGIRVAAQAPTQSASVETSSSMPSRA